jgi:hypothetical protein
MCLCHLLKVPYKSWANASAMALNLQNYELNKSNKVDMFHVFCFHKNNVLIQATLYYETDIISPLPNSPPY